MAKRVLITGTSTGFGRDTAERLARRGDHVFATMRDPEGETLNIAKLWKGWPREKGCGCECWRSM
jgi:NAD(P)-dependent dehydrogenase (short-subunit alcohol dehydrogenase family)